MIDTDSWRARYEDWLCRLDFDRAMQLTVPAKGNKITMDEVRNNAKARREMLDKAVGPKHRETVAKLLWKDGKPYDGRGR